jgi:hypothetical protein
MNLFASRSAIGAPKLMKLALGAAQLKLEVLRPAKESVQGIVTVVAHPSVQVLGGADDPVPAL